MKYLVVALALLGATVTGASALDIAEALGVLPGDGRAKRPWLQ
jgi:hypothetical protein